MLWNLWETLSISLKCTIFANGAFWLASAVNAWADHLAQTKQSPYLARLKLQPSVFLTKDEFLDVISVAAFNMLLVAPLVCCPLFEICWNALHPADRMTESEPWHWKRELPLIPCYMMATEFFFYGAHYCMHKPWLYQTIHKVHHRFKAPCAMAATYAHPIEFILGNVAPIASGPMLLNAHPYSAYFWFAMALLSTCKGHSGYNFLNAQTHDVHHQYSMGNYGVLHIGDFLMGTTFQKDMGDKGL